MDPFEKIINDIAGSKWQETEISGIIDRFKQAGEITEDDIRLLKPGRDMNVLVAKYVMSHDVVSDEIFNDMERLIDEEGSSVWSQLRPYSEDIATAQILVETMVEMGATGALLWKDYGDGIFQPAEAICKKALMLFLTPKKS